MCVWGFRAVVVPVLLSKEVLELLAVDVADLLSLDVIDLLSVDVVDLPVMRDCFASGVAGFFPIGSGLLVRWYSVAGLGGVFLKPSPVLGGVGGGEGDRVLFFRFASGVATLEGRVGACERGKFAINGPIACDMAVVIAVHMASVNRCVSNVAVTGAGCVALWDEVWEGMAALAWGLVEVGVAI